MATFVINDKGDRRVGTTNADTFKISDPVRLGRAPIDGSDGFDEVLIEALEDRLIAEQLSGLVIHHQNVDAFSVCHFPLRTIVGRF